MYTVLETQAPSCKKRGIDAKEMQLWMQAHYKEKITLQRLSEEFFITPGYVSFIFKQQTGKNISDYINMLRIEEGKRLLQSTDGPLKEIAEKVGYEEYGTFCRTFRKFVGVTPTEYKRQQSEKQICF